MSDIELAKWLLAPSEMSYKFFYQEFIEEGLEEDCAISNAKVVARAMKDPSVETRREVMRRMFPGEVK